MEFKMHERKPELPRSEFARRLLTDEMVRGTTDIGILLADNDDRFALYACRAIRRQLEALLDPIRCDLEYVDRFYQHDAVDYLMDLIRCSRAQLLDELGVSHPTQWTRGAKPRPVPAQFRRDYQVDLVTIKTGIAKHFSRSS
jgi:hypothetical protein